MRMAPTEKEVTRLFKVMNCDPLYAMMRRRQDCYRARSTPKPHLIRQKGVQPYVFRTTIGCKPVWPSGSRITSAAEASRCATWWDVIGRSDEDDDDPLPRRAHAQPHRCPVGLIERSIVGRTHLEFNPALG